MAGFCLEKFRCVHPIRQGFPYCLNKPVLVCYIQIRLKFIRGIIHAMNQTEIPLTEPLPALPAGEPPVAQPASSPEELKQQPKIVFILVGVVVLLLVLLIGGTYVLLLPGIDTAKVRDLFIIYMGFQSLVIGLALVILMIQLARLINLLQNEIKPILDSTNETVNHLRGTTMFLSDHIVDPVIKLNEYLAGITEALGLVGLFRRKKK